MRFMRLISNKKLREFAAIHPLASGPLINWRKDVESRAFASFAELKSVFHAVDKVGNYYVFNIGGNKYRAIAIIRFKSQKLFVREILTHREYNKWKP